VAIDADPLSGGPADMVVSSARDRVIVLPRGREPSLETVAGERAAYAQST
jgi:hypothetical protein